MVTPLTDFGDYRDPRGRSPVDPRIFKLPGTRVLGVSGQSIPANFSAINPPYFPWTDNVYELSIWDGKIYKSDGWAVMNCNGPSGRLSILPYLGDLLVANGKCRRILLCPLNIGGTSASDWCPAGPYYHRAIRLMEILTALEIPPTEWIHWLGQADVWLGTSTQDFAEQTAWFINDLRAAHGMSGALIVARGAYQLYADPARIAAIVAGQLQAALMTGTSAGPNDDASGIEERVDGVHCTNTMMVNIGQRWLPAFAVI